MSAPTYPCARCGTKHTAERMTFSKFTRRRYCLDTAKCEQRHLRLKKLGRIDSRGFVIS